MAGRITGEVIKITEVGEEPPWIVRESQELQCLMVMIGWFRAKKEDFESGDETRAIVERTENEERRFLRIHEILKGKNDR